MKVKRWFLLLLLLPALAFAATYPSWDALEADIRGVLQIKRAIGPDGERVLLAKIDNATIQDLTGIRKCWVTNLDAVWDGLSDSFEMYNDYQTRVPDNFERYEYLCWPIWVSEGYAGTADTAGIDLATNRLVIIPQGFRCEDALPFDGQGRSAPNGGTWDSWYWLRGSMVNNDNNTGVVARCHLEGG